MNKHRHQRPSRSRQIISILWRLILAAVMLLAGLQFLGTKAGATEDPTWAEAFCRAARSHLPIETEHDNVTKDGQLSCMKGNAPNALTTVTTTTTTATTTAPAPTSTTTATPTSTASTTTAPAPEETHCDLVQEGDQYDKWNWLSISFFVTGNCDELELDFSSNLLVVPVSDRDFFHIDQPRIASNHGHFVPRTEAYTIKLKVIASGSSQHGCQLDVDIIVKGEVTNRTNKMVPPEECGSTPSPPSTTTTIRVEATCISLAIDHTPITLNDKVTLTGKGKDALDYRVELNGHEYGQSADGKFEYAPTQYGEFTFVLFVSHTEGQWATAPACTVTFGIYPPATTTSTTTPPPTTTTTTSACTPGTPGWHVETHSCSLPVTGGDPHNVNWQGVGVWTLTIIVAVFITMTKTGWRLVRFSYVTVLRRR